MLHGHTPAFPNRRASVLGRSGEAVTVEIVDFLRARAGDGRIDIDCDVAFSESETGARNRSLAHFMDAFGNLTHPVETVVGVYFRQCAIAMSCRQLARAGLFLAMEDRKSTRLNSSH